MLKKKEHNQALARIRDTTAEKLSLALDDKKKVALLDFPSHQNVGDSMIWAGETAYLKRLGIDVSYVSDAYRFSRNLLESLLPEGPILLHGGGNFGDIWPIYQNFRENIVSAFPDRQIIQLPQTVFFGSEQGYARANRIFSRHPRFKLLVRDYVSYDRVLTHLPDVQVDVIPDMALGWTPQQTTSNNDRIPLLLKRNDHESSQVSATFEQGLNSRHPIEIADWGLRGIQEISWNVARLPGIGAKRARAMRDSLTVYKLQKTGYQRMLNLNLDAGLRLMSGRRLVVTDRLHAHILASLLDVPNIVLDNSYGKIRPIFEDFSRSIGPAQFATSAEEAIHLAEQSLS